MNSQLIQKKQADPDSLSGSDLPDRDMLSIGQDIGDFIPGINTTGLNLAGADYKVEKDVGLNSQTPFADILCKRIQFGIEDWPGMLRNQVVVDLCAGCRPYGYFLACVAEAKAYVGVDAHVALSLSRTLSRKEELVAELQELTHEWIQRTGNSSPKLIPNFVVAEDAATFMERITDNSVSILTIGMHSLLERDQYERLAISIPKALSADGCVVAYPEPVCCSGLSVDSQKRISVGKLRI